MLEWIGYLFEWVASLIPRLSICRATHAGIKFKRGKIVKRISPGLFFYWPIATEVELLPINRRTHNLESQTLTTQDNVSVTISLVVVYRVTDVIKAIVDTEDIDDTVGDIGLRASVKVITNNKFNFIRANLAEEVKKDITRSCRSALFPFGVKVLQCDLIDFAKTSTFRVVGPSSPTIVKEE